MKHSNVLWALSLVALFFTSNLLAEDNTKVVIVKKSDIVKKSIGVKGMTCMGCEVSLERAIAKVHGVVKVKASASDDNALIEYDKTKTDAASIMKSIQKLGYTPFEIVEKK